MKIALIGATGFVGTPLLAELLAELLADAWLAE